MDCNELNINAPVENIHIYSGIKNVKITDSLYPSRLKNISKSPEKIYYKGSLPEEKVPAVAIIGARSCTEYGRKMAYEFGYNLASMKINIISGMASGIDGISQSASLDAGGKSYAVLGCGVNVCYPKSNINLYRKLVSQGGIISEFEPDDKPLAFHFPLRNRIISGLADIVLVIEAREKSGTAITVATALEQGKEVFAVPGRTIDPLSRGCNQMIREGAGIATSCDEIIEALRLRGFCDFFDNVNGENAITHKDSRLLKITDKRMQMIYQNLVHKDMTADELYFKLSNEIGSMQELLILLMSMEMEGLVMSRGGIWSKV